MFDDIPEVPIEPDMFDWSTFDREEFKTWLENEAPGVYPDHVDLWLRMVDHRYPWESRRLYGWDSPKRAVIQFNDIMAGACAWVSPTGEIFPCNYAAHDAVCEIIIGASVADIEKTHARISFLLRQVEEAWRYVEKPTPKQKLTVKRFMRANRAAYHMIVDLDA